MCNFPHISIFVVLQSAVLQCTGNCLVRDLQISLSETLVWRAAEMVQRLDLTSLTAPEDEEHTEARHRRAHADEPGFHQQSCRQSQVCCLWLSKSCVPISKIHAVKLCQSTWS